MKTKSALNPGLFLTLLLSIFLTLPLVHAKTKPAQKTAKPPAVPSSAATVETARTTEVRWLNFEANANYLAHSPGAYTFGGGVAYSPQFLALTSWLDLSTLIGVQLSKEKDRGVYPIVELGPEAIINVYQNFYAAPGAGLGIAFQKNITKAFPYFGAALGYRFSAARSDLLQYLDRAFVRYSTLLAVNTTHQIVFGIGVDFK